MMLNELESIAVKLLLIVLITRSVSESTIRSLACVEGWPETVQRKLPREAGIDSTIVCQSALSLKEASNFIFTLVGDVVQRTSRDVPMGHCSPPTGDVMTIFLYTVTEFSPEIISPVNGPELIRI